MPDVNWLVPLLAALVGGGGLIQYVTRSGRLRSAIKTDLDMLDKIPDEQVRREFERHVSWRLRTLMAEETPMNVRERWRVKWGLAFLASGVLLPALFAVEAGSNPPAALTVAVALIGFGMVLFGVWDLNEARVSRNMRRQQRHEDIERDASGSGG